MIVLKKKSRKDETNKDEKTAEQYNVQQQPQVQPIIQPQQNLCTTCGQQKTYYHQNNKYYCHHCQKYE